MNLVCFGAGEKSRRVRSIIEKYSSHSVVNYIENQIFAKIGSIFDGLEVISIYKLKQLYENGAVGGGNSQYCIP